MAAPLRLSIQQYLAELERRGASRHTIRNYQSDLEQLAFYFEPPGQEAPAVEQLTLPMLREWQTFLFEDELSTVTIRRKLAAVRAFYKFLLTEGLIESNIARRLRAPKVARRLPDVPSEEKTNLLLDAVKDDERLPDATRKRDLACLELLYGCGIRVGELVGLNLEDLDLPEAWLRVRGKGNEQRQAPMGEPAVAAVRAYLADRPAGAPRDPLFLNSQGKRLSDRQVRRIVKMYAILVSGDSTVHPHTFRHAYATHLLSDGADLRAIQELLGHARLSTTQKYTQLSLRELQAVYDRAHPKA